MPLRASLTCPRLGHRGRGSPPLDRCVIADICQDLGIVPGDPLWRELRSVIIESGGNIATLFSEVLS
ncbi:MAG: hypothetical protein ABSC95_05505 [Acetobacteraceae bacterium]|jgi:hypothetical protein